MKVRNTFIIFIVSGFWHGANWTFIIWGALNAIYFLPLLLTNMNRNNLESVAQDKLLPNVKEIFQMAVTFFITIIAWIFFRASSVSHALQYIGDIFNKTLLSIPDFSLISNTKMLILLLGAFLLVEWSGRQNEFALEKFALKWPRFLRYTFYYLVILAIFWFAGKPQEFIYFQF